MCFGLMAGPVLARASLTPSRAALDRQFTGAEAVGYARARNQSDVHEAVRSGDLVQLRGNASYEVKETMSLPFARPEVRLFVETLAADFHRACGDRLVLTSLVRPRDRQPRNAHPRSVHQLGLAMDLRISWKRSCRRWLEANLLHMESQGILEASKERHPPHYHVVLFTDPYLDYLKRLDSGEMRSASDTGTFGYVVQRGDSLWKIANRFGLDISAVRLANDLWSNTISPGQLLQIPHLPGAEASGTYRVRRGDTLWKIAERYGTSTQSLQRSNALRSTQIYPGQVLTVPEPTRGRR